MPDALSRDVRERFNQAPFVRDLGIELLEIAPGRARAALTLTDRLRQQDGYAHAGVVATLADHTGGASGWTCVGPEHTVLSAEFKLQLLRPAIGPRLVCEAQVLKPGRTLIFSEASVFEEDGKLVAKLTMTMAVVKRPQPPS